MDADGNPLGTMTTGQALKLATEAGLDLVEISPTATPPVTRILDLGKYMYEKDKKQRESRSKSGKSSVQETKAVRITFRAGEHDLGIRAKQADKFLQKGHRVKVDLKLRGREKAMQHVAREKLQKFFELIETPHIIEGPAKMSPFGLSVLLRKQQASKGPAVDKSAKPPTTKKTTALATNTDKPAITPQPPTDKQ